MSLSHPNDIMQITCLKEDYVFEVNQQMTTDDVQGQEPLANSLKITRGTKVI